MVSALYDQRAHPKYCCNKHECRILRENSQNTSICVHADTLFAFQLCMQSFSAKSRYNFFFFFFAMGFVHICLGDYAPPPPPPPLQKGLSNLWFTLRIRTCIRIVFVFQRKHKEMNSFFFSMYTCKKDEAPHGRTGTKGININSN